MNDFGEREMGQEIFSFEAEKLEVRVYEPSRWKVEDLLTGFT